MALAIPARETETLALFRARNTFLAALGEHNLSRQDDSDPAAFFFATCCALLAETIPCRSVWAGDFDQSKNKQAILATSAASPSDMQLQREVASALADRFGHDLERFTQPIMLSPTEMQDSATRAAPSRCALWPVIYRHRFFAFIAIAMGQGQDLDALQREFVTGIALDIAFALHSREMGMKWRMESAFNKEIVETIQALMITIAPCGTILSLNRRAEKVTGYREHEVIGRYWVDVLTTPDNRLRFQHIFAQCLKRDHITLNFKAPLPTKSGDERHINWHGSIRHDIDEGQVGLVMLGIDETETVEADHQLTMLTARWKKIFIAIQDPVLVVSSDSTILEANPATLSAAKKRRDEVIGKKLCDILHCGHGNQKTPCPLEKFIGTQKTQILETVLNGLHGSYMLTVSPLVEEKDEINATLVVARNLTQEEVVRAEAIRAAQLAALGELASGVAHEINNPINGIINYAQILLDDPADPEAADNLRGIINEGKRIAAIVSNLLDFARCREEILSLSHIERILTASLQLVSHLLKKDGIVCTTNIAQGLPELKCNEQQLKQVVLNLISNARYALNKRFPVPCPEKRLIIAADMDELACRPAIRLTFTDHGVGIVPEIQGRLFDPFFSTKPKGEGTGLGLSISHGLVLDHGGRIKVQSKPGEWTRFTIHLPVQSCKKRSTAPS